MMAVAALSLAQNDSNARLDALQHYQQALPALQNVLRSADDLYSDGGFLTHFMLLVYEVSSRNSTYSEGVFPTHFATLHTPAIVPTEVTAPSPQEHGTDETLFRSQLPSQAIPTSGRNICRHFYKSR